MSGHNEEHEIERLKREIEQNEREIKRNRQEVERSRREIERNNRRQNRLLWLLSLLRAVGDRGEGLLQNPEAIPREDFEGPVGELIDELRAEADDPELPPEQREMARRQAEEINALFAATLAEYPAGEADDQE
jgi:hypothetical protein